MPDLPFTTYPFACSTPFGFSPGSAATRTMPDRYNDIINVKDFGATGDGVTDDTAAIGDAIAYADSLNAPIFRRGALIYFPAGTYLIGTPPLTLDGGSVGGSFSLMGAGRDATIIKGNTNGYLTVTSGNGGPANVTDLTLWNENTGTTATAYVSFGLGNNIPYYRNVHFIAYCGFVVTDSEYNIRFADCIFDPPGGTSSIGRADSATPGPLAGSVGAYIAQASVFNCTFSNFDIGLAVRGEAKLIGGNRFRRCNVGVDFGSPAAVPDPVKYPPGAPQAPKANATHFYGNLIERCRTSVYAYNFGNGSACVGTVISGFQGVPDPAPITTVTWAAGTATVETPAAHNIGAPASTHAIQLWGFSPVAWVPNGTANNNVLATVIDGTHFSYSLAGDPTGTPFVSGEWNYPLDRGILGRTMYGTAFASIYMDDLTPWSCGMDIVSFGDTSVSGTSAISMKPRCGWITPGDTVPSFAADPAKAGWIFINCGTTGTVNNGGVTARIAPTPWQTLNAVGATGWLEQEVQVVDAQVQNDFSGVVVAGGANHYKLRGDGTNWRRIG